MALPIAQGGGAGVAGLDSFLILPVQRLMRYKLLLERIVSLTDDQEGFLNLQEALAAVCDTIDAINDSTPLACTSGLAPSDSVQWSGSGSLERRRRSGDGGGWTWGGGISVVVAGAVGLGLAWGVLRLLRDREHTAFRLRELEITAEAAQQVAAAERLRAEQAAAAVETAKQTTKTVGAATAGAVAVAALLLLSDERVKCRVRRVGLSPSGLAVCRFAYCWAPDQEWEGVMAQDVLRVRALQCHGGSDDDGWAMLGGGGNRNSNSATPASAHPQTCHQSGCTGTEACGLPDGQTVHLVKDIVKTRALAGTGLLLQVQAAEAAAERGCIHLPRDLLVVDYSRIDVLPRRVSQHTLETCGGAAVRA